MSDLTHFDDSGASRMVNVGDKAITRRTAIAVAEVRMLSATGALIRNRGAAKGDVLEVARLAGIMAAKRTADLIPLCHPLALSSVTIAFSWGPTEQESDRLVIHSQVQVEGRTGVEMEALTAASIAALTVYDMCKSVDRGMTIMGIHLQEKTGGKSDYRAE